MRALTWKMLNAGFKFSNAKRTTVREIVKVVGAHGPASKRTVTWKKVQGEGQDEGTCKWSSWVSWVKTEWVEPRPEHLPVPEVSNASIVFPTSKHTPPWHWVPNEFKRNGDPMAEHENRDNPWCKVANDFAIGLRKVSTWRALPKDGINAQKAWDAIRETLGSWRDRVEVKIASVAYMMSEWYKDCWWEGDEATRIKGIEIANMFRLGEGTRVRTVKPEVESKD